MTDVLFEGADNTGQYGLCLLSWRLERALLWRASLARHTNGIAGMRPLTRRATSYSPARKRWHVPFSP